MKSLLFLGLIIGSFSASADYSCDGAIDIEINEGSRTMTVSRKFNGVVKNMRGGGEDFSGSASNNADFRDITVNVDDGDVQILSLIHI